MIKIPPGLPDSLELELLQHDKQMPPSPLISGTVWWVGSVISGNADQTEAFGE
ncbi:hypothetical protein [Laspinema palackyanum]|uniref:hypothetical protein n=1 Tax=Laspinema palackyanum TaxID=3231601 RepID=UPI00345CEF55|nr:hypothetical protein [Laspinema sp. D2c]